MRIISGTYGGRRLMPPKNITARPTTDFAKESLFNLLTNRMDFDGVDMLDLFAGTGGIGLEFVSRGAREVTAVEMAHTQQNFIISTCKQLGITNLRVVRGDVFKYIAVCHLQFDFIFADPPYALPALPALPDLIFGINPRTGEPLSSRIFPTSGITPASPLPAGVSTPTRSLLKPDGLFVLEHGKDYDFTSHPHFADHRTYGSVNFSFFA